MKKILPKLALALLPVALYLALFIAFEPNNYFGLRKTASSGSPIARLRAYENNPQTAVILGDSRMAHFDMALVEQTAGRAFSNAAYGGASLEESIDEFYFLYGENPSIDTVVLGVSFYTLNNAYRPANRMKTVATQLKDPSAYVFNLEYNINMLTVLKDTLLGRPAVDAKETAAHSDAEYRDEQGGTLPIRNNLIDYAATLYANCAAQGISLLPPRTYGAPTAEGIAQLSNPLAMLRAMESATPADSKFAVNETALARLLELASFCRQNGVELTVVLPPMHESVRTLVCAPLRIDDAMRPVLDALHASGARVLDYEWDDAPDYSDAQYYDGFHLDTTYGLPEWTKTLFGEVAA